MSGLGIVMLLIVFMCFFLILLFVVGYLKNNKTKPVVRKFLLQAEKLSPDVFKNIKMRHWATSGYRTYISPCSSCDLYLFDDYLVIVRTQNFIYRVHFAPIIITSYLMAEESMFSYLELNVPDQIIFKQVLKGEIEIRLTDLHYKHYKTEITLKGLTDTQMDLLERMRNW
jgi:hypothetical protein